MVPSLHDSVAASSNPGIESSFCTITCKLSLFGTLLSFVQLVSLYLLYIILLYR